MNPQLGTIVKKLAYDLCIAFAAFFLAISAFFAVQPQSAKNANGGGLISPLSVAACSFENGTFTVDSGCVQTVKSGGKLLVQAGATEVHQGAESHTGTMNVVDIVASGNITVNGSYAGNITPVATATSIAGGFLFTGDVRGAPTLAAGGVLANAGVFTTSVGIAGTPVVAYATPNISGGLYEVCGSTNISTTGTIVLPHGLATPSYVVVTMAQDATGDGARVSTTNISATVTVKGWNTALTPAANTTPIAINYCVIGTK